MFRTRRTIRSQSNDKQTTEDSSDTTLMYIEKTLYEPFLIHGSNIPTYQAIIDCFRTESKQLSQQGHDIVVVTHEEMMKTDAHSCEHSGQVHILLALNAIQLHPTASSNYFSGRFIDKHSEIVVYLRLHFGLSSVYINRIDDKSVHVQVFQPSRLNYVSPQDIEEKEQRHKGDHVDSGDFMSLLRVAMHMNQNRNDFGLSILLQNSIVSFFRRYTHFYSLFEEVRRNCSCGVLSKIVKLVRSEICTCNSKCLVSGRTITPGFRPGFVNTMKYLNKARTSGFGFSLLRHYLKYEEHVLRYILLSVSTDKEGHVAPFPCLYHDKQKAWSVYAYSVLANFDQVPTLNHLKELSEKDSLNELSNDAMNQLLWLVLSNRVYLSPTTIPNSKEIFGTKATLYAFLSVDTTFEDRYEKVKGQRNKQTSGCVDKIVLLYPQFTDNLFATLTTIRKNSSEFFMRMEMKTNEPQKVEPEFALVVQYLGKKKLTAWEQNYRDEVGSQVVVPRLFIWYEEYKKPKEVVENYPSIVSWCSQFRATQF